MFCSQDFGDYQDGYYSVQTTEGEQIAQLIAGYIDIILKKVTLTENIHHTLSCCVSFMEAAPQQRDTRESSVSPSTSSVNTSISWFLYNTYDE